MRDLIEQNLKKSGIIVKEEDLASIEVLMEGLYQLGALFEKFRLDDVVPVMIFRAEGGSG